MCKKSISYEMGIIQENKLTRLPCRDDGEGGVKLGGLHIWSSGPLRTTLTRQVDSDWVTQRGGDFFKLRPIIVSGED